MFSHEPLASQNSPNNSPKLHMFIVGDVKNDELGSAKDVQKIEKKAEKIAEQSGMELSLQSYVKTDLSNNDFISKVDAIECGKDDVIWFYYSGHGFNSITGSGSFSAFGIGESGFSLEVIHAQLMGKGARLVITMLDACNYLTTEEKLSNEGVWIGDNRKNYFALFRESAGSIKISSNRAGYRQYSFSSPDTGGLFTSAFLSALDGEIMWESYENCSWKNLLKNAKETTQKSAVKYEEFNQTPYFEVDVVRYKQ